MDSNFEIEEFNPRERVKQEISVPFNWELKPGKPNKDWVYEPKEDWISEPVSLISFPSPCKLVVTVPFKWEQEPGKPIISEQNDVFSPSSCSWNPFLSNEQDYSAGFDLDNFNNPFVSEPILGENQIVEEKDDEISEEKDEFLFKQETWSLSETEESNSSESSIICNDNEKENGFDMDMLFSLSSPEASFLNKIMLEEHGNLGNNDKHLGRRVLTLEELIMLSRKLSYRNNKSENIIKKKNPSMPELFKKILITCF